MNKPASRLFTLLSLAFPFVALATEPSPASSAQKTYYDDPAKWASPKVVLPPTYPADALAKGVTAVVELSLKLTATGRLDSIVEIGSEPKLEVFESAVRDVLKHWTFEQSLDTSCRPVAAQGRLKVWFEIKAGQPSISVTHLPVTLPANVADLRTVNRAELMEVLAAGYPRQARIDEAEAQVYAKLSVNPVTGETQAVDIVTMSGHPRIFKKQTGSAKLSNEPTMAMRFAYAASVGLKQARYQPGVVKAQGPISVCEAVDYRLVPTDSDEKK